jgi:hypothetical protein
MAEDRAVVWISHKGGERCSQCGAELFRGAFIQIARETGIRCMECAGFTDLVYLPSGDQALTRRAAALTSRRATVVRFSKTRKRNERQGILVEEAALEAAKKACEADAARREKQRERRGARAEAADQAFVARFAEKILELYPGCPRAEAEAIARHACQKHSGRVGRSAAAKAFDERAIRLAVRAHIRHQHTKYDELVFEGLQPAEARMEVADRIQEVYYRWLAQAPPGGGVGPDRSD